LKKKHCTKVDGDGRVVRNHCPVRCEFCEERCENMSENNKIKVINPEGKEISARCKNIPNKRVLCTDKHKEEILVREICRGSCDFCDEEQSTTTTNIFTLSS